MSLSAIALAGVPASALALKSQAITFTSSAPTSAAVGGPTYVVTATGGESLNPVTFAIDATSSSVCSISGSTVSFIGAGTCTIDANQAGGGEYEPAPQAQQSFIVGKGSQTITFTSSAPSSAVVEGPTYAVSATGGASGNPVTFAIDAASTSVCSISGVTVSFIGVGTCTIDANQAGDANYNEARQEQQSFVVGKGSQAITFTSSAPTSAAVAGPTYAVSATGGKSGNPVALTIDAASTSVCSISGVTVSFIGVGTCTIDANQAGDANYNEARQEQQSFVVGKGSQAITFSSTPPSPALVGGASYAVTAAGGVSGNPVAITIDAASTSVCSISGSTVSFNNVGTCTIDANQAGNASFNAAPQQRQSFAVGKGSQTIAFTSQPPSGAMVGQTYAASASASSGLAVVFTSATPSVCTISGSAVTLVAAGTCTIDADQTGNPDYNAAQQQQQSFFVAAAPTIPVSSAPIAITVFVPNSAFKTLGAVFNPSTRTITFTESVVEPGTFSWLLTFRNGKYGVYAARNSRCKSGFTRLKGKCRPTTVLFARGSSEVASAGTVTFTLKPTASALKALIVAHKQKKSLPVTMTLSYQSARGGNPVLHALALTVRTH